MLFKDIGKGHGAKAKSVASSKLDILETFMNEYLYTGVIDRTSR